MTLIDVKNVTKVFDKITAVDHVSISIEKGDLIGLLGPNGAGKSTLISMISTLYKPTSGDIRFDGQSVIGSPQVIQPFLGYVPQDIALYESLTGYENLKYFGKLYHLKGGELKDQISKVSDIIGISDRLNDRVSTYSGGMKRRINIGVALLHNPKILIMDEPTVGIDPQSRNHILETVSELNERGMTVIYTSHYMEEVELLCKKIHIMDRGKIIAEGSKESLLKESALQTTLFLKFTNEVTADAENIKKIKDVISVVAQSPKELIVACGPNYEQILKAVFELRKDLIAFDVRKPNLEQVFLNLTGRGLRD